ncbi:MAG: zinc-binding alcohol dehydrogenase [Armatimonadetes bacterium]|nr:zinc-binding alcohol dehydrogenase [Armatimonadota bacterium]
MSETRRVLAIDGRGRFVVIEQPVPEVKPGQVRIRVGASLVSPGTELGGVRARRERPDPGASPRPFGYSNAGEVVSVGEGVTRFRPGQRIAAIGGGYALHATDAVVPQNLCAELPDGVPYARGAFGMLAATALHAIRRAAPEIGEHFLVVGLGPVGQLAAQWARIAGTHTIAWDRLSLRLEVARRAGCDRTVNVGEEDPVAAAQAFSRGHGLDAAVMAFGGDGTEAFKQILRCLKLSPDTHRMGRVVIVGGATVQTPFAAAIGNVDLHSAARTGPGYHDDAWEHGDEYPAVFLPWNTRRNLEECLRFIREGRLLVEPIITHRVSLDEAPAACDALVERPNEALGVVVQP